MDREAALDSIRENIENANLIKHMLATEAIMGALARRLGGDEEEWALAGLLHDIDVELTGGDLSQHSRLGADLVKDLGASREISDAILTHNEAHGISPESLMAKALFACDPLTGLITAVALVRPDKKLASVQVKSVSKRMNELRFAAGANRDNIRACSELGLELNEFIGIGLEAMQGIAEDLGL